MELALPLGLFLLSPVLRILKKNGWSCAILIQPHPTGPSLRTG